MFFIPSESMDLAPPSLPAAQAIAFTPDGDKLILAAMDASIHVVKIADLGTVATFSEHCDTDADMDTVQLSFFSFGPIRSDWPCSSFILIFHFLLSVILILLIIILILIYALLG